MEYLDYKCKRDYFHEGERCFTILKTYKIGHQFDRYVARYDDLGKTHFLTKDTFLEYFMAIAAEPTPIVRPKRVYICGPISNMPDDNKPAFENAQRVVNLLGFDAINPHDTCKDIEPKEWTACMKADIKVMVDCDYLVVLKGWDGSKGAILETSIANQLMIPIFTLEDFITRQHEIVSSK